MVSPLSKLTQSFMHRPPVYTFFLKKTRVALWGEGSCQRA